MDTDTDQPRRAEKYIKANFSPTPVPTVPELCLRKAGPRSGLRRLAEMESEGSPPYWAYVWGGGVGLARYILDHPDIVAGCRVLDLGSGSGLVAIAAAKAGADRVIAADIDRHAVVAARVNADENGVKITVIQDDLTDGEPPDVDVVLVGDLFYEAELAQRVTTFLDRCLIQDIKVFVGDPGRAYLPRARLNLLAEHVGPDFGSGGGSLSRNSVYAFSCLNR